MVIYLDEYQKEFPLRGKKLNYYNKLPEYLHEMSVDDIIKEINRYGEKSRHQQQSAVVDYFMWLSKNYDIDVVEKFFELKKKLDSNESDFIGFYSLEELKRAIDEAESTIEYSGAKSADWNAIETIFYLEWYGLTIDEILSINLTDVAVDGTIIDVPLTGRKIEITDNGVSGFFARYKASTGFQRKSVNKESPYTQNTFIRNTSYRGDGINIKSVYNLRGLFIKGSGDHRFEKSNVYNSGRFYVMYQEELRLNTELNIKHNRDLLCGIFNNRNMSDVVIAAILRQYKVYKKNRI